MTILQDFQAYLEQRYAPATVSAYLRDVTHFFRWFEATNGEEPDPRAVVPSDIREYRRTLLNGQARPATINRRLAALSNFFRWARATGLAPDNPAQEVPGVRQTQLAPKWLSRKEQNALLRAGRKRGKSRDEAVIIVLLHTGLRVSELCDLGLPDLQLSQRKGEVRVRGKGEKERVVPLNAEARKALKAYLDVRPAAVHDYVFVGQRGDPMQSSGVQRLVPASEIGGGLYPPYLAPHVRQEPGGCGGQPGSGGGSAGAREPEHDPHLHDPLRARSDRGSGAAGGRVRGALPPDRGIGSNRLRSL